MITDENKKPKTDSEKGVKEHEKANYTPLTSTNENDGQSKDHPSIKETDNTEKKDDTGGDLAGNAAGNTEED
ncbi:hypothetical protein [Sphingobacterium griseoflavum]|uniref:Uncharacterized protein n=1 Tax=Sphingobacterium griseoflavum TaxID=1474952 RepID=A0ABQ3HPJ6_9SPHI|nr:hypothetical protein [Sphingobacterium griseoflavum]GHE23171.1 hypothetical protein GCM10017764_01390 [Sphingobacterium griseoflavum]